MKKIAVVFTLVLAFGFSSMAQEPIFSKGDKVVNLGIGFGTGYGLGYKTTIPPLSASFEMGVKDGILEKGSLGVGGYLGFSSYTYRSSWYGGTYGWNYTNFILGARGVFHYPFIEKLDTYTGLLLGFRVVTSTDYGTTGTYTNPSSSGLAYSWFVGGRYYFTDRIAGMLELGYGISYLNLGVAIKL